MADNEKIDFRTMTALTLETIRFRADMSKADKQLLDKAAKMAFAAAISAAKQIGVKTSIALYHIGTDINSKAVEQYLKERSDRNAET